MQPMNYCTTLVKRFRLIAVCGIIILSPLFRTSLFAEIVAFDGFEGVSGEIGHTFSGISGATGEETDRLVRTGNFSLEMKGLDGGEEGTSTFNPVDLTGFSNVEVSVWFKVNSTSWEQNDLLVVSVAHNGTGGDVILFTGNETEFELTPPTLDLQGYLEYSGTIPSDATTATLSFLLKASSDTEIIFFDDVLFDAKSAHVEIDRLTGAISLINDRTVAMPILGYSIQSSEGFGALNQSARKTIADNYDATPGGPGQIDSDDEWTVLVGPSPSDDFSEFQFDGDGGALAAGQNLVLGEAGAWTATSNEDDLFVEITLENGDIEIIPIVYTGNNGSPLNLSDLNASGGTTDVNDWIIFRDNFGAELNGLTLADARRLGDLDGDLDSDLDDYQLFRNDYETNNGAGSFSQMLSSTVPEPSSLLLVSIFGALGLAFSNNFLKKYFQTISRLSLILACVALMNTQAHAIIAFDGFEGTAGEIGHTFSGISGATGEETGSFVRTGNFSLEMKGLDGEEVGTTTFNPVDLAGFSDVKVSVWFKVAATSWEQNDLLEVSVAHDGTGEDIILFTGNETEFENAEPFLDSKGYLEYTGIIPNDATTATLSFLLKSSSDTEIIFFDDVEFITLFDLPHLSVNSDTGEAKFVNPSDTSITLSSYILESPADRLLDSWAGLTTNAAGDAVDGPDADLVAGSSPGESWEKAPSSDEDYIAELFLDGNTTIGAGESISLGTAYQTGLLDSDMTFTYYDVTQDANLNASVLFVSGQAAENADFDGDGDVDGSDFLAWQVGFGAAGGQAQGDANGDGNVNSADFDIWQSQYGNSNGGGSLAGAAVPEPSGFTLLVLAGLVIAILASQSLNKRLSMLPF